uniref:Uncharacterized protein n=1 Tax=Peronospora matthiolae TaxID=2874970 RepID=A0AAV1UV43_9STRA
MRLLFWFLLAASISRLTCAKPVASTTTSSNAASATHANKANFELPRSLRGVAVISNGKHPVPTKIDEERMAPLTTVTRCAIRIFTSIIRHLSESQSFRHRFTTAMTIQSM